MHLETAPTCRLRLLGSRGAVVPAVRIREQARRCMGPGLVPLARFAGEPAPG